MVGRAPLWLRRTGATQGKGVAASPAEGRTKGGELGLLDPNGTANPHDRRSKIQRPTAAWVTLMASAASGTV